MNQIGTENLNSVMSANNTFKFVSDSRQQNIGKTANPLSTDTMTRTENQSPDDMTALVNL